MALGTGTHWEGPLLGSRDLYEEIPVDIQSRRFRSSYIYDWLDIQEDDGWTLTTITSGTAAITTDLANGVIRISATVDAQGIGSFQPNVSNLLPSTVNTADGLDNRIIAFGARFSHSNYDIANWFFGLGAFDTTFMGVAGDILTPGADNMVGWHHIVDATAQGGLTGPDGNNLRMVSAGGGVANYQATMLSAAQVPLPVPVDAAVDGVMIEYGIRIIGTQDVEFYRNGVLRHRRRMTVPLSTAVGIIPTFCLIANGTIDTWDVDYVWGSSTR